jgi:hypothetical protein
MRGRPQDLFDDTDACSVAKSAHAGANVFARNRERNGDHLTAVVCDAVAAGVQVIDGEVAAT